MSQLKTKLNLSGLLVLVGIFGILALSACGDATATTPPPATSAVTTAPPTTSTTVPANTTAPATTAVASTKAATTIPATVVATTKAATTVPATTAATNNSSLTISGAKEIQLDPTIAAELFKGMPGVQARIFASTDDPAKLATNSNAGLLANGFKFAIPGQTTPVKGDNEAYLGVYSKAGTPDLVMVSAEVPKDAEELERGLASPSISPEASQNLLGQLAGKKSVTFLIVDPSGTLPELLLAFSGLGTGDLTTPVTTAPPANRPPTFAPASNKTLAVDESILPVYPGAKRVDGSPGKVNNEITVYFVSSAKFDDIKDWAKNTFDPFKGNEFNGRSINTSSLASKMDLQGKNYNLKLTIVNALGQREAEYKEIVKLAKAGPNDIVMIAVLTPPNS